VAQPDYAMANIHFSLFWTNIAKSTGFQQFLRCIHQMLKCRPVRASYSSVGYHAVYIGRNDVTGFVAKIRDRHFVGITWLNVWS